MATVKQSDNPNNSLTVAGLDSDEFVPKVSLHVSKVDESGGKTKCTLDKKEDIPLSKYLDNGYRNNQTVVIETSKSEITLPFEIIKGNRESDDDKGIITVTLFKKLEDGTTTTEINGVKITNEKEFETTYGSTHSVKLEFVNLKESTDFYIDFFAKDDNNDVVIYDPFDGFFGTAGIFIDDNRGKLKNVHCGRVKVVFIDNSPKNVDIVVTNKVIRDGLVRAYPHTDGKQYIVPTYVMNVIGVDRKGKSKSTSFEVIRYGVERNETKNIKPHVVGLSESQSYKLNWVDYMGGSWQVKGDWLIHRGAEDPTRQAWGALGCIEVCGVNGWNEFNNLLKELSRVDDFEEISTQKLLKIEYLPVFNKPELKIK